MLVKPIAFHVTHFTTAQTQEWQLSVQPVLKAMCASLAQKLLSQTTTSKEDFVTKETTAQVAKNSHAHQEHLAQLKDLLSAHIAHLATTALKLLQPQSSALPTTIAQEVAHPP